jgi:hypothetical protein
VKLFLRNLFLFALPFIFTSYFLDILISNNLKKSNFEAQKEYSTWNAIFEHKIDADIVIYGGSRAWVHINSSKITDSLKISTYNLGIDGHNFWLQNLRHSLLIKNNLKPKLIIHSLDIFTLQKRSDLYNENQFLPYMLWNNEIKNATTSYNGFKYFDYYIPLIRYYGKYKPIFTTIKISLFPQNNSIERIRGYQGQIGTWNNDFDLAKAKMKTYKANLDSPTIKLFENYLQECKTNNIKIIFVYTPEYIEGQKFIENRKEIINLYKMYGKRFDIPFYDFSNDSISFDKKNFYNALHLNKIGAELFTDKFIDTLKRAEATTFRKIREAPH